MAEPDATADEFHILSLSGGGYLGLFTAIILADLEQTLGKPIARAFDLIAGTSIGGLLALALALEVPADELVRQLEARGQDIFSSRSKPKSMLAKRLDMLRYLVSPKYRTDALERALDEIYAGQPSLGEIPGNRVIVPAVNLTRGAAQVFRTPHLETHGRDHEVPVRDVALATSAAPTYFPIKTIDEHSYTDGGLFAQSPDLVAIHEAEHFLGVKPEKIRLLSLGTTTSGFSIPPSEGTDFGMFNWAFNQRLWLAIMSSQQQVVKYMASYILGDRYVRIDAAQSEEQNREVALDVATPRAQQIIRQMAEATLHKDSLSFGAFAGHDAPRARFFHGPRSQADA